MSIKEKASALREYMTANWNQCDKAFYTGIAFGFIIGLVLAGL
jgi:hypothetical protein